MTAAGTSSVSYWEQVATTRWGRYISAVEAAHLARAWESAPMPRHALDVGCGGGRWTRLLLEHGWAVTALDVDPEAVKTTAGRNPAADCRLVDTDSHEFPVAEGSASILLCIEVPKVIHSGWFLAEARRVLTPGGRLVTVIWNRSSLRGLAAAAVSRIRSGGHHPYYQHPYGPWQRRLLASGFRVQEEQGLCWFPFGRASDSRLVPFGVAVERRLSLGSLPSVSPWVIVTASRL